nr:MAG TPA_asm: hypothetical protein [Caudoviricetes sp.]
MRVLLEFPSRSPFAGVITIYQVSSVTSTI